MSETKDAASRVITMEEVASHASEKSAWIAIHGYVYDVTSFADDHPGGADILLNEAGTDATGEFEDMAHSLQSREQLLPLKIGILKGAKQVDPIEFFKSSKKNQSASRSAPASSSSSSSSSSNIWMLIVVIIPLATAIAWKYFH